MSTPTPSTNSGGRLLAEFAPVTRETWKAQVEAELKGAPFDKKMLSSTYEGITLQPIYCREDGAKVAHLVSNPGFGGLVRGGTASGHVGHPWDVSQELAPPTASEFNDLAHAGLARGLTALNMVVDRATRNGSDPDWAEETEVGMGGLSVASLEDLRTALRGIDLGRVPLFIRSGASGMPVAALMAALIRERRGDLSSLRGCIEIDPLGVLAHEGRLAQSLESAYREMAALTDWASKAAPGLQTMCVHARAWHESGGNAVQELGFALATALEYVRAMDARGLDLEVVAPRLRFAYTVGSQFFTELAKLRAARLLWARLVTAMGGSEAARKTTLHVRTSLFNKTVFDPYVNMLRTTVESFAGVLGGCDALQVGAFDEVLRVPDLFSQRIARNQQLVLREECQLTQVIDPAGGSWYVETLTAELAARAWAMFQEVEKLGGMAKALQGGWPQGEIAKVAEARLQNVSRRRDSIVGTNVYANPTEKMLERPVADWTSFRRRRIRQVADARTAADDVRHRTVLDGLSRIVGKRDEALVEACIEAAGSGATLGEITRAVRIQDTAVARVTPVRLTRAAEGFERLRSAVVAHGQAHGGVPKIFLATMGPAKQHKARADFSRGFLEVAGFEVLSGRGLAGVEEAHTASLASGAVAVCICSTDETYPALVPLLVQGLKAAHEGMVVILAGYPPDQVEAHRAAGVDEFIHLRANALEVLTALAKRLGVSV